MQLEQGGLRTFQFEAERLLLLVHDAATAAENIYVEESTDKVSKGKNEV